MYEEANFSIETKQKTYSLQFEWFDEKPCNCRWNEAQLFKTMHTRTYVDLCTINVSCKSVYCEKEQCKCSGHEHYKFRFLRKTIPVRYFNCFSFVANEIRLAIISREKRKKLLSNYARFCWNNIISCGSKMSWRNKQNQTAMKLTKLAKFTSWIANIKAWTHLHTHKVIGSDSGVNGTHREHSNQNIAFINWLIKSLSQKIDLKSICYLHTGRTHRTANKKPTWT